MKREKKYSLGWLMIAAAGVAIIAGVVFLTVDWKDLVVWYKRYPMVILGAGAAVVVLALIYLFSRRGQIRSVIEARSKDEGLEPPKPVDAAANAAQNSAEETVKRANDLKLYLKERRWFLWAYAQPWIFVAGDSTAVTGLFPELAKKGWLATDDIVLLWGGLAADGRPDELAAPDPRAAPLPAARRDRARAG